MPRATRAVNVNVPREATGWGHVHGLAIAWMALLAVNALAQQPSPSPSPGRVELHQPPAPPPDAGAKTVAVPGPRRSGGSSADAGALRDLRALSLAIGVAQVNLGGATRRLRVGDAIAGDVVKAIGDGRIVLARRDPEGGEATVVVRFDAQGRASVRVISLRDRTKAPTR